MRQDAAFRGRVFFAASAPRKGYSSICVQLRDLPCRNCPQHPLPVRPFDRYHTLCFRCGTITSTVASRRNLRPSRRADRCRPFSRPNRPLLSPGREILPARSGAEIRRFPTRRRIHPFYGSLSNPLSGQWFPSCPHCSPDNKHPEVFTSGCCVQKCVPAQSVRPLRPTVARDTCPHRSSSGSRQPARVCPACR